MTAAIYRTSIRHVRRDPLENAFTYRSYSWFVDLDALPLLPWWLRPLAGFHAKDHLGDPAASIRENVDRFLAVNGAKPDGGKVTMLANARVLGQVFNPISLFWCHGADGALHAVIAEVHNTYGERHCYLLHPDEAGRARTDKDFYVSPFNEVDGSYLMNLPEPDGNLAVAVVLERAGRKPFHRHHDRGRTGRHSPQHPRRGARRSVGTSPPCAADPLAGNQTLGPRIAHHQPPPPPITGGSLMTLTDPTYQETHPVRSGSRLLRRPSTPRCGPASPVLLQERRQPLPARRPAHCSGVPPGGCRCALSTPTGPCWGPGTPARR